MFLDIPGWGNTSAGYFLQKRNPMEPIDYSVAGSNLLSIRRAASSGNGLKDLDRRLLT
jgi:hypothetical protein